VPGDTNGSSDVFVVENPFTLDFKAIADSNINEDNSLTVSAPGVLSNDLGDGITVTAFDPNSAQGAVINVNPDGSYSYDPKTAAAIQALGSDEAFSDTFNYAITDGSGATAEARVKIDLTGVNDAPLVETEIPNQIANNTNPFSLDVSSNFKDVDASDQLSFTATELPSGLSIDSKGIISGQPETNGAYLVTITAQDLTSSVQDEFTLTINELTTGTPNDDLLTGDSQLNLIYGLEGNDTIFGLSGGDRLFGGDDNDFLAGGNGNDRVYGGYGNDALAGGYGNDALAGGYGNGNDRIAGGYGNDFLIGGDGIDLLVGGENADTFILQSNLGLDKITDFSLSEDHLRLAAGFQGSLSLSESAGNTTVNIVGANGETAIALLQGITDVTLEQLNLDGNQLP
jgi:VCBS repeat-containing protein